MPYDLIPALWARLLYGVVFLIVLALLFIDVVGISDWNIDNSTIALIVVLAFLPLLGRIKSAKLGTEGVSVEMFERVENKLMAVENLTKRNAVGVARAAEFEGMLLGADEEVDEPSTAEAVAVPQTLDTEHGRRSEGAPATDQPPLPITRIVWVDDNPEGNAPYQEELERRWEVIAATSTSAGQALIAADPARTLVITDAVRDEAGDTNYDAGLELINWSREKYPDVPVVVFAGDVTVQKYGDIFRAARASAVTADFGALLNAIGAIDRRRFMAATVANLKLAGLSLVAQPPGVDLLARRSDGRRVAIEVKTWQRTPSATLLETAIGQLAVAQRKAGAEEALLIVRTALPQTASERLTSLPSGLQIVPLDELAHGLGD